MLASFDAHNVGQNRFCSLYSAAAPGDLIPAKKKERNAQLSNCQNRYCVTQSLQHTEKGTHLFGILLPKKKKKKTDRCQVGGKGVKEAPNWAWNAVRQHRVFWVMDSTLRPVSWRNVSRQLASSAPPSAPVAWRLPVFQQLVIHCLLLASKAHVMGCQLVQSTIDASSKITFLSFLPIVGKNCWAY